MIDIIITADVMGLLICLVTLYGNCFESRQDGEIQKRFSVLVLTTVFMLIIDTLSYVTAHVSVNEAVRYAVDIIANIGTFVIASAFAMYLYTYVKVKYGKKLKRLIFLVAADVAFTVIALVGCLTKGIFSIENGVYVVGPLYGLYIVLNVLMFVAALTFFTSLKKIISRHDMAALFSYILCPSAVMVAELFASPVSVIYPSFAIMALTIYIMLQSETEKTLIEYGMEASRKATHDALTGLLNRNAYDAMCAEFMGERKLGVIYIDANGLKYANDNYGHKAGDELLTGLAALILSCSRKEEVFRIGGDEFVILLPGITEEAFWNRVHLIDSRLDEREVPMASLGAAFGVQQDYEALLEYAENEMYRDKKQFYVDFPDYARE